MTILVTGSNGYIGSNLLPMLTDYKGLVSSLDTFKKPPEGVNCFVHLAAWIDAAESNEKPMMYWENNLARTIDLIDIAKAWDIKSFVFASSAAVHGDSIYGKTKLYAEEVLKTSGLTYSILRLENVVGGVKQHDNFLKKAFQFAMGDEGYLPLTRDPDNTRDFCKRDFIHVEDVCRAILAAVDYNWNYGSISCDIGLGKPVSLMAMYDLIGETVGRKPGWTSRDPFKGELGTSSADTRNNLDWAPQYTSPRKVVRKMWRDLEQTELA